MLNMQAVFDKVYQHALTQSVQAGPRTDFPKVSGRYKDRYGNKCFIGILIDDKQYFPTMENRAVTDTIVLGALAASNVNIDDIPLMFFSRLQHIHDTMQAVFWTAGLDKLAADYNLNVRTI